MTAIVGETRERLRRSYAVLNDRLFDLEDAMADVVHNVVCEVAHTGWDNAEAVMDDLSLAAKLYRYQELLVDVIEALPSGDPWPPFLRPTVDVDTKGLT